MQDWVRVVSTQVVGPEGCNGAHQRSDEERSLLLNCIEAQAANQEIEPLGMMAFAARASPRGG